MSAVITRLLFAAPFAALLVAAYVVALIVEGLSDLSRHFSARNS
jgi:hypothetical protein